MHARINYVDIKPSSFVEVDEFWRTKVRDFAGLTQGYFLRNGETAHTLSFVVFDTEKSMVDNTEQQLGSIHVIHHERVFKSYRLCIVAKQVGVECVRFVALHS